MQIRLSEFEDECANNNMQLGEAFNRSEIIIKKLSEQSLVQKRTAELEDKLQEKDRTKFDLLQAQIDQLEQKLQHVQLSASRDEDSPVKEQN